MKSAHKMMLIGGVMGVFLAYLMVGFVLGTYDIESWDAPGEDDPGGRLGMLLLCIATVPAGMLTGYIIGED